MGVDYVQGFGVQKPRRLGGWLMEEALALSPCSMGGAQSGWRRRLGTINRHSLRKQREQ